CQQHESYPFTF
nr:immunoglobulin light chain junction region [Macaca mulatta]MOW12683.1 immunoglobulin light chain junction region [Macaca mulatta]